MKATVNETKRGWWWRQYYDLALRDGLVDRQFFSDGWHDWPDNVVEEDGDIFLVHEPPTSGLAGEYNIEPYRYRSANPGNGWNRWTIEKSYPWQWADGRHALRKVVNELAGYRDAAIEEVI